VPHDRPGPGRTHSEGNVPESSFLDEKGKLLGLVLFTPKRLNYALRKPVSMAKSAAITIPTEPIGSIPRPVNLIERIAKSDREGKGMRPAPAPRVLDKQQREEAELYFASL